ncbi:substrate-binding domain-containing protein [Parvicella tangerina]|uniref:PBP domain-containing protein n=1 Tax=Parvicella tangerina TaxID=2829795 RepID=A0A916JP29_9FLAO|nr:substrate-binding domain-containing protein [Parvicella tangerina]CAG5085022.1 hypothetical protein CRYO30217_02627 [Parvicella tangerina]
MYLLKNSTVLLFLVLIVLSCGKEGAQSTKVNEGNTKIVKGELNVLTGSETELELVKGIIATSENDKLADYEVVGGGSKLGIKRFIDGEAKFVNSSVRMSSNDKAKLKENGRYGLMEIVFALDAVAVITNAKVGVDSLSIFQLKRIFQGEAINWKEFGGEDLPIKVYRRNEDSGTNQFFWGKVLQGSYGKNAKVVASNDKMLETIESTPGSVGYLGIGTIRDKQGKPSDKVWAVNIYIEGDNAKSPYSFFDVVTENYYLARPLYQYFMVEDKDQFKELIQFELSPEGQSYIKEQGFFPITEEYAAMNQFYLEKLTESK